MKELEEIVNDLKHCLAEKEEEITSNPNVSSYAVSALQNRQLEVALFEKSTREVTSDPTQKANIITNFTIGAKELKAAINSI
ncbi:hypothetical protein [Mucilaginibacter gossypii]|uniref:Uncharacterized protein n=1 Tax=Mucilaginibacter gossypii TaxID=551996 RepID=A0A1G7RKS9_9SPHI|nr:hypothetical protein [Mucilaginibacter gossypii]SDG11274.1 hypothetical protein SAMN05192573_102273 [Mucilaginibacter gossypii]